MCAIQYESCSHHIMCYKDDMFTSWFFFLSLNSRPRQLSLLCFHSLQALYGFSPRLWAEIGVYLDGVHALRSAKQLWHACVTDFQTAFWGRTARVKWFFFVLQDQTYVCNCVCIFYIGRQKTLTNVFPHADYCHSVWCTTMSSWRKWVKEYDENHDKSWRVKTKDRLW